MKILFLASRFPYPITKGDQLRTWHFLNELTRAGHNVSLISAVESEPVKEHVEEVAKVVDRVITCEFGPRERYLNLLKAPFLGLPFQVMYFYSEQVAKAVSTELRTNNYDVIICQMVRTAPYGAFANRKKTRLMLDFQDAYSLNMQKRFKSEKGLVKFVAGIEWRLLKRYEHRLVDLFDISVIIAQRDKDVIGDQRIRVLPNGVDLHSIRGKRVPHSLVFTGNLQYFPNREAITWFASHVFPHILNELSGATLVIAGATPPPDVLGLASKKGVSVVPNPDSLVPIIGKAQLAVAPMRSGSGLQNKVLEAMAVGTPVAVTGHALEGIGQAQEGILLRLDDDAKSMAAQIVALLRNENACTRMGQRGRKFVQEQFSWNSIGRELDRLLNVPLSPKITSNDS